MEITLDWDAAYAGAVRRELLSILPVDLPNRDHVALVASRHMAMVEYVNRVLNLTRILEPREAAVKHVYDSVAPFQLLASSARILDLGSGAGFPGIPLAAVYPDKRFWLAESTAKKAAFLEHCVDTLELGNVVVRAERGEDLLRSERFDATLVRAVAPVDKLFRFLKPVRKNAGAIVIYKGRDVEEELRDSVAMRYELPYGYGSRSVVEYRRTTLR